MVGHTKSLYVPVLHVLLVVVPLGGAAAERRMVVVSIRDVPTTVMDAVGLAEGSPFPSQSLLGPPTPGLPWASARVAAVETHARRDPAPVVNGPAAMHRAGRAALGLLRTGSHTRSGA